MMPTALCYGLAFGDANSSLVFPDLEIRHRQIDGHQSTFRALLLLSLFARPRSIYFSARPGPVPALLFSNFPLPIFAHPPLRAPIPNAPWQARTKTRTPSTSLTLNSSLKAVFETRKTID